MTTFGFSPQLATNVQMSLPVRAVNAVPYARGNRITTVRFATTFSFPAVAFCEEFIGSQLTALKFSDQLRWEGTPPGAAFTGYLWKSKLISAEAPPYLGSCVTIFFTFIGSHIAKTPDPNPDPISP